jgi:hypothetical protein
MSAPVPNGSETPEETSDTGPSVHRCATPDRNAKPRNRTIRYAPTEEVRKAGTWAAKKFASVFQRLAE